MTEEPRKSVSPFSGLLAFTVRALVVVMLIAIAIAALIPDIAGPLKRELRREEARIRISGLLTSNPYVHMRVSQIREQKGDLQGALDELELAIGLFELHGSDKAARERYVARRDELKKKLTQKN